MLIKSFFWPVVIGAVDDPGLFREIKVGMGIVSQEIAQRLPGDDGAGNRILFRDGLRQQDLQGFLGAAAEIGKKPPIVQEISAPNLRDAEDEMAVGYLLEDTQAQPFPELHQAPLRTRGAERSGWMPAV